MINIEVVPKPVIGVGVLPVKGDQGPSGDQGPPGKIEFDSAEYLQVLPPAAGMVFVARIGPMVFLELNILSADSASFARLPSQYVPGNTMRTAFLGSSSTGSTARLAVATDGQLYIGPNTNSSGPISATTSWLIK